LGARDRAIFGIFKSVKEKTETKSFFEKFVFSHNFSQSQKKTQRATISPRKRDIISLFTALLIPIKTFIIPTLIIKLP